jgi:tRNA (cytidine/uridine-2'-O-)-methyltransferase
MKAGHGTRWYCGPGGPDVSFAGFALDNAAPMPGLHIALLEPEIHWNTGNIGRTSLAVGAELHLIEPLGFSLDDKQVRRAGLDYWPRVRLSVWRDWAQFERALPSLGQPYFFSSAGAQTHWAPRYPDRTVLVFGRESVGLPVELLARYAAQTVQIPMRDRHLRSLNLSTAAALASYEVIRQWDAAPGKIPVVQE